MNKKLRVTILDDHQSIVDGYVYRLEKDPQIEVAATIHCGEDLEPTLAKHPTDVLLLDVNVPASAENRNPYQATLKDLGSVVKSIAAGGVHFSQIALELYTKYLSTENNDFLSPRQLEVLSLCAAYPDSTSAELADKMSVSNSTIRNLLSAAYLKLGVHNRAAAIAKARETGLITPNQSSLPG